MPMSKAIFDAIVALEVARNQYDNCSADLVDVCIYQINIAEHRLNSLLKEVKDSQFGGGES